MLRTIDGGNLPHILDRIASHRRALASVLPVGVAHHHCGNPSSALQLEKLYGGPVLFSGLASLVLSCKEISAIHRHHRATLCRLQKLAPNTPDSVVYFLAGSLPGIALLHLKQLGLFGMLARQGRESILVSLGIQALQYKGKGSSRSWFSQLRSITQQYGLKDPLLYLQSPQTKLTWKNECKAKVISWWETKLRGEADLLTSLTYFHPSFMSLAKPHPVWTLAESPFEVKKAVTMANMLSGRYVTDHRSRYWSASNPQGNCQLCLLENFPETPGTLEHLLLSCPALADVRKDTTSHWSAYMVDKPFLLPLVSNHTINLGEGV